MLLTFTLLVSGISTQIQSNKMGQTDEMEQLLFLFFLSTLSKKTYSLGKKWKKLALSIVDIGKEQMGKRKRKLGIIAGVTSFLVIATMLSTQIQEEIVMQTIETKKQVLGILLCSLVWESIRNARGTNKTRNQKKKGRIA